MKIVFIEPRSAGENVYSKLRMPLLGPIYLGTILKKRGHEVEVYNEGIHKPDYSKLNADVIGISILTSTAPRGYEIAKKFPREKVIIGGVHASLLPGEAAQYARQVIIGEADEVIADVVEGRLKDRFVYGRPVRDLDTLPYPDFSIMKWHNLTPFSFPVSTSRGCPFDCSFCSVTKMFGREYRFRSAENVIGELIGIRRPSYFFCDDNFTANQPRTKKLLDLMIKNRVRDWACQVRCDAAKNDELLKMMRKAGCEAVCIGFESVNEKTLQAYDKKQTVGHIVDAIRSFHKRGIKVHGMFVVGGEDDNKKTIWDTVKFAIKHKIDTIQIAILTPFPGTKVYDFLEKQKRIFSKDWSLYDGHHVVFDPKLVSAKELQTNVLKSYMKFYSIGRAFSSVLKLRMRNAFFNFMGFLIVKKWKASNRVFSWIDHKRSPASQEAMATRA